MATQVPMLDYWGQAPDPPLSEMVRADVTRARAACVGKEAVVSGRTQFLVRVEEMNVEESRWSVALTELWPVGGGERRMRIEFGFDDACEITAESWYFPRIGELYLFDEKVVAAFRARNCGVTTR